MQCYGLNSHNIIKTWEDCWQLTLLSLQTYHVPMFTLADRKLRMNEARKPDCPGHETLELVHTRQFGARELNKHDSTV